jgi:cytochrome c biogenesis protein CcmG, thiol:disulfide interchange protein DsbE
LFWPESRQLVNAITFFAGIAALATFFVYKQATQIGQPGMINVGQRAPGFAIKDEHGQQINLSDYQGKLVFLHFWASWCAPCIHEAPDLEWLKNEMKGKPFELLPVSIDIEEDAVREFDKRYDATMPALLDPGQQIARGLYKITGQPETFLISPDGVVLKHIIGPVAWSRPEVIASIRSLLPASY